MATDIVKIKEEINLQLADVETLNTLVQVVFNGMNQQTVKRAILEGMMRGFTFEDFLKKDVYAIPFKQGYTLITSIDYARKLGMRNGIVGKDAPIFEEKDAKIISCSVTVHKKTGTYVGDFTATVYFNEYYKAGKNGYPSLWDSKPHTMIAKVAEMHAQRMACPEQLSQMYVEEEYQHVETVQSIDVIDYEKPLKEAKTLDELRRAWIKLPGQAKKSLKPLVDELKKNFEKVQETENSEQVGMEIIEPHIPITIGEGDKVIKFDIDGNEIIQTEDGEINMAEIPF